MLRTFQMALVHWSQLFQKCWSHFYPPTKSEGYGFGIVRPSIPSVRPHFLSVRKNISVPIGQI